MDGFAQSGVYLWALGSSSASLVPSSASPAARDASGVPDGEEAADREAAKEAVEVVLPRWGGRVTLSSPLQRGLSES